MFNSGNLKNFKPILPARYNTAAYLEWKEYFFHLNTSVPSVYLDRLDIPIRNFLIYSCLESVENGKVPVVVFSKEITPNLALNFPSNWFTDFFSTLKQLKITGIIVTDSSEEGQEVKAGIQRALNEESSRDWLVEDIERFEEIEGVCNRYMEIIEERSKINIEYKNIR